MISRRTSSAPRAHRWRSWSPSSTLSLSETLDAAILDCLIHSLVQIRIYVLRIELRVLQHSNNLFELFLSPSGLNIVKDISNIYMYVQCTKLYMYCLDIIYTCIYM
jgi:hypothetical protein